MGHNRVFLRPLKIYSEQCDSTNHNFYNLFFDLDFKLFTPFVYSFFSFKKKSIAFNCNANSSQVIAKVWMHGSCLEKAEVENAN